MKYQITGVYILLLVVACSAQTKSPRTRTIDLEPGVSIASRLLPDDQLLIISAPEYKGDRIPPETDPNKWVFMAVSVSNLAAVVRVESIHGRLTSDESFIETELTLRVSKLLFTQETNVGKSSSLHVVFPYGGELSIRGCDVKAGVQLNLVAGRSYLAFLAVDQNGSWHVTRTILAIDDGRVTDTWRSLKPAGVHEPLEGVTLGNVEKEIRRVGRLVKLIPF